MKKFCLLWAIILLLVCAASAQVPPSQHVYILLEENHSYESVVGQMPYLNSLTAQNALLINSYANSHYSIPNYMWLTTGAYVTMNDNTTATFDVDNIIRHLATAGEAWKEYAESLPYAGYTGGNTPAGCTGLTCTYIQRHNPFVYFSDVVNSAELYNVVPFSELAQDIANGTLPNYAFITPNGWDDGHNTPDLSAADSWLQTNIAPLLAAPPFQPGGDGILIVTFDESLDNDCRPVAICPALPENQGGGQIYTVIIGPRVKAGYQSNVFTEHTNVLRTMMEALGLASTGFPGATANVFDLADVFVGTNQPLAISPTTVNVAGGQTIQFAANNSANWSASDGSITSLGLYTAPTAIGSDTVTATDSFGNQVSATVNVTSPPPPMVIINSPASASTISSPVTVSATFSNGGIPQYMKLWADGTAVYSCGNSRSLNYTLNLSVGTHYLTVQANDGTLYKTSETVFVNSVATAPSVTISSPLGGSTVSSPVSITANFNNGGTANYMKLWVDGAAVFKVNNTTALNTTINLAPGTHKLTVQAYNGTLYAVSEYVMVR